MHPSPSDIAAWLRTLTVTQGAGAGEPFEVLGWQRSFLDLAFGAGAEDCALTIARGAGKTTFCAAIAAATVAGPLRQPGAETLIVASSFLQARVTWDHVLAFLRQRHNLEGPQWRLWDSQNVARLVHRASGAKVRTIASDPKRMHGLAPALVLADEPAQWERAKADQAIAALRTGLGKIPNGRLIAFGTRPALPHHWFEAMLRDAPSQIHAAPRDADPLDESAWIEANPSLVAMPALLERTRAEALGASRDPAALASFRALRLNAGVPETVEAILVDADVWREAVGDAPAEGPYILGLDPGYSAAMSAAAGYWPDTGRLEVLGCFGRIPDVIERGRRDGVGTLYADCVAEGSLLIAGERVSDVRALLAEVWSRWGVPEAIVSDRWRAKEVRDALAGARFPLAHFEERGMGFRDGSEDVRSFRDALYRGRLVPVQSTLLTAGMAEARVTGDPAGNEKLAKSSQAGRRQAARDDVVSASLQAVGVGWRASRGGVLASRGVRSVVVR